MAADDHYVAIDEISLWDDVWAQARGCWRAACVVKTSRAVVTVAFRRAGKRRLVLQELPLDKLRRRRPARGFRVVDVPAPSCAEIVTAMATGDVSK